MNEQSILPLQIEGLREDLTHIENILNSLDSGQVDLIGRVRMRLDHLLQLKRTALTTLETDMARNRALSDCWKDLRGIRRECRQLFQVCLALIEGALLRQNRFDGGICRIAEALLDELNLVSDSSWKRFTIWSDGESFTKLDEVIRVRFPSINIWHLPVAAHEFGHFIGRQLEDLRTGRRPFRDLCAGFKGEPEAPFLSEYFADVFATYTLGPSYVCACVTLRFDHGAANAASETHPSAAKRVYIMLRTLAKMDETSNDSIPQYEFIGKTLSDLWRNGLKGASQVAELEQSLRDDLDEIINEIYTIVSGDLPPRVRYNRWLRAQELSNVLKSPAVLEYKVKELRHDDTIVDVVNAAWLTRVLDRGGGVNSRMLSNDALSLCNAILAHRQQLSRV
jgi:hypothetical protein